jgi:hypothetical protein
MEVPSSGATSWPQLFGTVTFKNHSLLFLKAELRELLVFVLRIKRNTKMYSVEKNSDFLSVIASGRYSYHWTSDG